MKILLLFSILLAAIALPSLAAPVDFETQIAPILSQRCVGCHSPGNKKGEVSLASIEDLMDNQYITDAPETSHLIELIAGSENDPAEMPKEGPPLTDEQVELFREWIRQGAKWPRDFIVREQAKAGRDWWSLQPIRGYPAATIDEFVLKRLKGEGLSLNPPGDRRSLIRRASYDLIGLPPTPEEIDAFVQDDAPDAYDRLLDRLLDSPHYGERWARHWLDVVRFGESNGYERNVIINNLWPFRDYVIRSLNQDKPSDQFIREHIAGDVFGRNQPDVAVGTAFLVAGPYDDVGNQDAVQAAQIRANTIDEIIRSTTQAFLGLTVGCARCHDHKFDPILQRDYYSFYSIFSGIRHGSVKLSTAEATKVREDKLQPLNDRLAKLQQSLDRLNADILQRGKSRAAEYEALWARPPVDRRETVETFEPVAARYVRLVCEARDDNLNAKSGFGVDEFEIWSTDGENVALESKGAKASGASRHIEDFKDAYSARLAIDGRFGARFLAAGPDLTIELPQTTQIQRIVFSSARGEEKPEQGKFSFVAEYRIEVSRDGQTWQEVAHGRDRKPTSRTGTPSHLEFRLSNLATTAEDKVRRREIREQLQQIKAEISKIPDIPSVWIGTRNANDAKGPHHVFLGGDPQKKGEQIVPASLSVLRNERNIEASFQLDSDSTESERRAALANWISSPDNPLTARVLANRIWHYHFGIGIVDTPSDFGYMGGRPTHPELLDFLATKLIENGWRMKALHRLIMTSRTYRQSSRHKADAAKLDGDARLYWRFRPRRLSAEEVRDTMLFVAGKISKLPNASDKRVPDGGPGFRLYHFMQDNVCTYVPLDDHGPETYRRAVYHQNARASVVDLMTEFDQPDRAFSTPKRAATTTPLQALTMLNHQFTLDMANFLSARLQAAHTSTAEQITMAYQQCYGRSPRREEVQLAHDLIQKHGLGSLCRVLLNTSEFIYVR